MKAANLLFPILLLLFSLFCGYFIHKSTYFVQDKHFVKLAQSFVKNDLFLSPNNLPAGDYVDYKGKQYLFFGPLPTVILMPFVLVFGENFWQMYLSFSGLAITYVAVFLLCRKFKASTSDSLWLANFFVFGTVLYFVGLVNISAYVVQATAMPFVVLALLEYFTKKRWLVMGILVAAAIATRATLLGMVIFFLAEIWRQRHKIDVKKSILLFMLPVILCLGLLGIYNYRRFHSFTDTGYTRNVSVLDKDYLNNKKGFFNIVHIPANLYSLFLMGPQPVKVDRVEFVLRFPYIKADGFGLAIWFTSPLFFFLVVAKRKQYTISALLGIVALVFPSLIYFGIGASQFGYRYGLDFYPLLFLILLSSFEKGLGKVAKSLIVLGIVFDLFYMLSIWNSYPLFFWLK